ncbi:MAG: small basic protein [Verrucomicrobia bacterium]|nr:small basic protein [Verrucomicrobiota bacterium]
MSQHPSLKLSKNVGSKRSVLKVLKRFERIKLLRTRGEWKEGTSPLGLPKTKPDA